jgi:glyoxylase-like metal-dependent hydrolase (beta-lactamase superfamily II)
MSGGYRFVGPLLALAAVLFAQPAGARDSLRFAPWINGTAGTEPQTHVQRIDPDSFVIRQSVRTNFEAPFLDLLFGSERALLIDSGAGGLAIRPVVDAVIEQWLASHDRVSIPLVVAHSHSHGDHIQGDSEFAARPDTRIVGLKPAEVAAFFNVAHWPYDIATFDLGRRQLSIIPTPGHEPAHIMVYDKRTQMLFSGDMLYAGRLYVPTDQFATFVASVDRVVTFAKAHPVAKLLGAHIEMTTVTGKDYPMAAAAHPDEHALELSPTALARLQAAAHRMADAPVIGIEDDFIIYPRPPRPMP